VPGPAWAQSPGLGWALAGSGLPKPKPDPELRAGPGLGLVGLKPGLMSQRGNWLKYYIKIQFSMSECAHGQPHNSTHRESCQVARTCNRRPTGSPKRVTYNIVGAVRHSRTSRPYGSRNTATVTVPLQFWSSVHNLKLDTIRTLMIPYTPYKPFDSRQANTVPSALRQHPVQDC
jgi:hypothetical protein